jgi:uncharacterized protein (DUF2249 family)
MTAEPITLSSSRPGAVPVETHPDAPVEHACACGHEDSGDIVLDSRPVPHAIRHATIFGALGAIKPGFALDLIASHNPLPLLGQLESSRPGEFLISYLENGPETWTIRLTRTN